MSFAPPSITANRAVSKTELSPAKCRQLESDLLLVLKLNVTHFSLLEDCKNIFHFILIFINFFDEKLFSSKAIWTWAGRQWSQPNRTARHGTAWQEADARSHLSRQFRQQKSVKMGEKCQLDSTYKNSCNFWSSANFWVISKANQLFRHIGRHLTWNLAPPTPAPPRNTPLNL